MADELNSWYEKNCVNGSLAWSFLAKKSGVSVSQICKIARGQVANPKYQTQKQLLEALYPDDFVGVYEYLLERFPENEVALKSLLRKNRKKVNAVGHGLFKDRLTFRLFKFADCKSYTIEDLEKEFGRSQIEPRIEALLDADYIEVDEQGFVKRTRKYEATVISDVVSVAEEFHHVVDILASKKIVAQNSDVEIDQMFNRMTGLHNSYSEEALAEMAADVSQFLKTLYTKYKDEKYRGSIPVFLNIVTGRFDSK